MKKFLVLLPLFTLIAFFHIKIINLPYVGPNATDNNNFALIAHNYNHFGFLNTKFAPILTTSAQLPNNPWYYLHHPPLLSISMAIMFQIFGESIFIGRLTAILFSLGSVILIYLIADSLRGKKFAVLSLLTAVLIPATTVFGRQIDLPTPTLFFCLLITFFILKSIKKKQKRHIYLAILFTVLGTLTDWPVILFAFSLLPFFSAKKDLKTGISIFLTSFLTGISFLVYSLIIAGNFQNLYSAILNRSLGSGLFSNPFWFISWPGILLVRFLVYFNPILFILSGLFLITIIKSKKKDSLQYVTLAFFLMGALNIILFPEGSFGHPFWIYYLTPFVVFSSAYFLDSFLKQKKYWTFGLILIFSMPYLLKIEDWKTKEILGNVWKYELAKKVKPYLKNYQTIAVNKDGIIDEDLLNYHFLQATKQVDPNSNELKALNQYLYSCESCSNPKLNKAKNSYKFKKFDSEGKTAYLFFTNEEGVSTKTKPQTAKIINVIPEKKILREMYIYLKSTLKVPQI